MRRWRAAFPIGILDFDGTQLLDCGPLGGRGQDVNIVARVQDLGEAQALLVQRKVYAVLVIPRHFRAGPSCMGARLG